MILLFILGFLMEQKKATIVAFLSKTIVI